MSENKKDHEKLRMIRDALGYKNQFIFGETIGLSQGGYSDIERGRNKLTPKIRILLKRVHNVNLDFLDNKSDIMFLEGDSKEALLEKIRKITEDNEFLMKLVKSQQQTIDLLQNKLNSNLKK